MNKNQITKGKIRSAVILSSFVVIAAALLFGSIKSCGSVDAEKLNMEEMKESTELGVQWILWSMNKQGFFNYGYFPLTDSYSTGNNEVRQLMASRLVGEICFRYDYFEENGLNIGLDKESVCEKHRKNIQTIIEKWYVDSGEIGYILFQNKSKLGGNAMALRALVYSPYFDEYKEEAEKLAAGIVSLMTENGSFNPWLIEPYYEFDSDYLLTFYSGEAILSLVEYYELTGREEALSAAIKSQDYYIDRYVVHLSENYYPAYVPWHTQSLNKLYKITNNQKYADAIFILNDELLKIQNTDRKSMFLGRFYSSMHPEYGNPHSSSDGVYTEGVAYAYEIAKLTEDKKHEEKYYDSLVIGVGNLIRLQYKQENVTLMKHPERALGGIRTRSDDGRIRIDTTQHAMDAFLKILNMTSRYN